LGHGLYVVEIHIRASLHDMPIGQILGDAKGSVQTVLVKRDQEILNLIGHDFIIKANDIVLLCGTRAELKYLAPRLV
ncbi:TrkA family potassium uptake protein, partial [Vibrio cholerae]|nr:TrkA family potassium uptake protein [Vibrio cholerae]